MKIKIGQTEKDFVSAEERQAHVLGAPRKVLELYFSPGQITAAKLESFIPKYLDDGLTIIDDDGKENIHTGYTVRGDIKLTKRLVSAETSTSSAIYDEYRVAEILQETLAEHTLRTRDAQSVEDLIRSMQDKAEAREAEITTLAAAADSARETLEAQAEEISTLKEQLDNVNMALSGAANQAIEINTLKMQLDNVTLALEEATSQAAEINALKMQLANVALPEAIPAEDPPPSDEEI